MTVELVELSLIDDNPYQPRSSYPTKKIEEIAYSIEQIGLIHKPTARRDNGRFQIAEGHLRKRAFLKLYKKNPKKWSKMPLDIQEIPDKQMAIIALEENMKRQDITPLDLARTIDRYLIDFSDVTETSLAKTLNMTQGNISNMRRVLKIPTKVLEKIEEGKINFTMGRELLIFQGLKAGTTTEWSRKAQTPAEVPIDEEYLMLEAIRKIGGQYGPAATVDGLKRAIDSIAETHFPHLFRGGYNRREPLFDTTPCKKCPKAIKTWPTKSESRLFCTDEKCWEKKQTAHQKKQAEEARKKMEADIAARVAAEEKERQEHVISQEIPAELREPIDAADRELEQIAIKAEKTAISDDITDSIPEEEREEARRAIANFKNDPRYVPCRTCLNVGRCERTTLTLTGSGKEEKFTCENQMTKADVQEVREKATVKMPAEFEELVKEKAGTRAEVLDLRELRLGPYGGVKQGYVVLKGKYDSGELDRMLEPEECLERCTKGFHYAFDSDQGEYGYPGGTEEKTKVYYICSDPKCAAKKKAALTRAENAAGQAKKRAEMASIKEAVQQTSNLDTARMKLIILAQMEGKHVERYGYSRGEGPDDWFYKKLKLDGAKEESGYIDSSKRRSQVIDALKKLTDEEMSQLIVEFMLSFLTYRGDIQSYKVQTTEPLNWMGIGVSIKEAK